ncbi:MAG: hypothetical protein FWH14_06765 [Oscillospiraceae bacterium]|nr:hypothetical protein [Oscillospiraceae bacterium]
MENYTTDINWDITYDEDDTPEEREAWRQEIEHDRRIWNTPQVTEACGRLVEGIISGKIKTRPAREALEEWQKWVDENKQEDSDE